MFLVRSFTRWFDPAGETPRTSVFVLSFLCGILLWFLLLPWQRWTEPGFDFAQVGVGTLMCLLLASASFRHWLGLWKADDPSTPESRLISLEHPDPYTVQEALFYCSFLGAGVPISLLEILHHFFGLLA